MNQIDNEVKAKIVEFGMRAIDLFSESKAESLSPQVVTDIQSMLAGYSAVLEEEYAKLNMLEPIWKSGLQLSGKSEVTRKRAWECTIEGQRQIALKHLLHAISRIITACNRRMERFKIEAYNSY